MSNTEQFVTLLNQPVDDEHRYVVEVASGTRQRDFSASSKEAWAYIRRRIVQDILQASDEDEGEVLAEEVERWAVTEHCTSTEASPAGVAAFVKQNLDMAKKRIPNVQKGVNAYVERNAHKHNHMMNGELASSIARSTMFTREQIEAALLDLEVPNAS